MKSEKPIKISIYGSNSYFSLGLTNILKDEFNKKNTATDIIESKNGVYADIIFQHSPQGEGICFCNYFLTHKRKPPLFFSIKTQGNPSNKIRFNQCILEREVIHQDISISSAIDMIINCLNNKKTTDKSNCSKIYFSKREIDIIRGFKKSLSIPEIARKLGVSPKTVSGYKIAIMHKMGFKNNAELYRWIMSVI
ncbi:response regulator transcription factor [Serratia rhizosphaerae]|uniref:Response regulator transcription factor n=1 Tax=Serratia rhizosphaerae TaxID=2597702 RepID=A0ABX6GNX8_9GAMM|nr:LuxR C-terminal-related transcriptional regulator [Serratia rhizosphaerae]QHA87993.1 response regulator transcription factor [Serratia rhizosphaerae]